MDPTREELASALAALVDAVDNDKPGQMVSAVVRAKCLVDRMKLEATTFYQGKSFDREQDDLTWDDVYPKHPDSR